MKAELRQWKMVNNLKINNQLMKQRNDFYIKQQPINILQGTNRMSGYISYVYSNGISVIEKKQNPGAAYIVKQELLDDTPDMIINYRKNNDPSLIIRVLHKKNWKKETNLIIRKSLPAHQIKFLLKK